MPVRVPLVGVETVRSELAVSITSGRARCLLSGLEWGRVRLSPIFRHEIGDRFHRKWTRGRPKKKPKLVAIPSDVQGGLFTD